MRLTRYSDYAYRVLLYLSYCNERTVTIAEMAQRYGISHNHLVKVVHNLVKAGYVTSRRGRNGGVSLAETTHGVPLGTIMLHAEPDMLTIECDGCAIEENCGLPSPVREARDAFIDTLNRYTVSDLSAQSQPFTLHFEEVERPVKRREESKPVMKVR